MRTFVYAYNPYSESAKALARALPVLRIRHKNSRFRPTWRKRVINWGSSKLPPKFDDCLCLNDPYYVGLVANKKTFFETYWSYARLPDFTTDMQEAIEWTQDGHKVVERHILNGHSGAGIRIVENYLDIQPALLYTRYIKKRDEYRIHCMNNKIIDIQLKKKKLDFEGEANYQIRNHANGFIYARQELDIPEDVLTQALSCFKATKLDFAAIDVVYNAYENKAYVLEVNTAPGLHGETLIIYANAFQEIMF